MGDQAIEGWLICKIGTHGEVERRTETGRGASNRRTIATTQHHALGSRILKVLFRFNGPPDLKHDLDRLSHNGLSVSLCSERENREFEALLSHSDVLWHVLRPVTAEAMDAAPRLRLIQKIGVGVNTIDLEAAKSRGIAVCNMPGTNSRAVAEIALALMLAALRRLPAFDAMTRRGEGWSWPDGWQGSLGEIAGKTVGLVGFGAVPRLLAPILTAMGAKVIYTNRRQYQDVAYPYVSKEQLLERADIVSLHLPLTEITKHWLDAPAIAELKTAAVVVNVARGGLIDEAALHAALVSGKISAAGLDVHGTEPAIADNPLFKLPQVAVTPHVAWLTRETLQRSIAVAVENCHRLAGGDDLLHRVV